MAPSSSRRMRIERCSSRVPHRTASTGVAASIPAASSRAAMAARWATPISTTRVPPAAASASQFGVSVDGVTAVSGHDGEGRGQAPVGDGHARIGRNGDGRRDARHHLKGHPGRLQGEDLLAAATEHERVAAFEPDDLPPGPAVPDQHRVDGVLIHRPAGRLPDVDALRPGRRQFQEAGVRQPVVHDDVGAAQQLGAPDGQQARVAGPGPDQVDGHRGPRDAGVAPARSAPPAASSSSASAAPTATGFLAGPDRLERNSTRPSAEASRPSILIVSLET